MAILIKGGHVLTMDARTADLPVGDVLVESERIAAVAPTIDTVDAEIIDARGKLVLPGMIDSHRHTWQTQMRGLCADWTLGDYFRGIRSTIAPAYAPDDVYVGNLVGSIEAINAGVTTILDFSHCNNTPAHSDAAVQGLADAGIRAIYGYGFSNSAPANASFMTAGQRLADFARVARGTAFASGLLRPGAALAEVGMVPWDETVAQICAARELGAWIVAHTGCVWGSEVTGRVGDLYRAGLLGPDQVHVHCNTLDDDEWAMLAEAGCKVSISPETEMNMGMGRLAIGKCREFGIRPSLSCDIISLNSGDLFAQARLAIAYQRFVENDVLNQDGRMPEVLTTTARDAIEWATINGAIACGLDEQIGTLTPGKQADVIVVGRDSGFAHRPINDPYGTLVFQSTATDVDTVIIAGRVRKANGRLVGIDLGALLDRAAASAASVLARVPPGSLPSRSRAGGDAAS